MAAGIGGVRFRPEPQRIEEIPCSSDKVAAVALPIITSILAFIFLPPGAALAVTFCAILLGVCLASSCDDIEEIGRARRTEDNLDRGIASIDRMLGAGFGLMPGFSERHEGVGTGVSDRQRFAAVNADFRAQRFPFQRGGEVAYPYEASGAQTSSREASRLRRDLAPTAQPVPVAAAAARPHEPVGAGASGRDTQRSEHHRAGPSGGAAVSAYPAPVAAAAARPHEPVGAGASSRDTSPLEQYYNREDTSPPAQCYSRAAGARSELPQAPIPQVAPRARPQPARAFSPLPVPPSNMPAREAVGAGHFRQSAVPLPPPQRVAQATGPVPVAEAPGREAVGAGRGRR